MDFSVIGVQHPHLYSCAIISSYPVYTLELADSIIQNPLDCGEIKDIFFLYVSMRVQALLDESILIK